MNSLTDTVSHNKSPQTPCYISIDAVFPTSREFQVEQIMKGIEGCSDKGLLTFKSVKYLKK